MEGPSLVILREELARFVGKRVASASGNTKQVDLLALESSKLIEVRSWGKHLLLRFSTGETLKVHFLMYGSYRIDEEKPGREPRLSLVFGPSKSPVGVVHFYSCSIKPISPEDFAAYDWSVDPMSGQWSELKAIRAVQSHPDAFLCDVLLNQEIFSGVGNIIKNEVLHQLGLNPLARVRDLPRSKIQSLVKATREYCFQFYEWKKKFELKKNWQIYRKKACAECGNKPIFKKTGKLDRVSFYCADCQALPGTARPETKRPETTRKEAA